MQHFPSLKKQAFSLETQVVGSLLCTVSAFALMNWSHLQGAVASSLYAMAAAPMPHFDARDLL
jgi:hypothetical protein